MGILRVSVDLRRPMCVWWYIVDTSGEDVLENLLQCLRITSVLSLQGDDHGVTHALKREKSKVVLMLSTSTSTWSRSSGP